MSRRQCSRTFQLALALIGAGVGNRPFPSMLTTATVPTNQRTQAWAAAQRASSIGWCDGLHGTLWEGQTVPKIPSNKELQLPSARVQSANSGIQGSQRLRCSQQVADSDRPLRAGILMLAMPGREKRSSLRQLTVFPNSRAEPNIQRIYTFNAGDFEVFPELIVVVPGA